MHGTSGALITTDEDLGLSQAGGAERLAGVFNRIAHQLHKARELRKECADLRQENAELREVLAGCVTACDRFLAPTLEPGDHAEDDDQAKARQALDVGRRVLARRRLRE